MDDLEIVDDFNLGLHNLGGNVQFLEERGLGRVNTGGTGLDGDILGGDRTDTGGSLTDLGVKGSLDLEEISFSENYGGVSLELSKDLLEVGKYLPRLFSLFVIHIFRLRFTHESVDGCLHHRVFTADHKSIDLSHLFAENGDLLGGNVVRVDEQTLVIGGACRLEGTPEFLLPSFAFFRGSHLN